MGVARVLVGGEKKIKSKSKIKRLRRNDGEF